ncbi:glycosyltransferase [Carnobacterium gallinarum]|uniref:glycosyltransferase n=1 Tax=Carnobacterium gallinarum TaxID=2749 RepID=UPI00054F03F9|nr:glycosyltransferase [Carnobacterium gallinarum]
MKEFKKIKIDLVAVPFSGHLYPLLELASPFLEDERYEVRVITGVQKIELVELKGFTVVPLFPNQPFIMEEIANTTKQISSLGMYKQLQQNMAIIPEAVQQIKDALEENQTDIVVADFIAAPAGIACQELAIPWITTIPTPFAMETRNGTPTYLGGWKKKNQRLFKLRDAVGRKIVRFFTRFVYFLVRTKLKDFNFQLYNEKGEEQIYSPYSILGLGMEELEWNVDFPEQFKWAGPCCASLESEQFVFEDTGEFEKKILLTIGTHLLWGKDFLIELAQTLSADYPNFHFILSMGNSQERHKKPTKVKGNITVYAYLPYTETIEKVDYVIHHGGAGILYNCIKFKKPALIIPHDYDQFDYAVRAEWAGIGIVAKKRKLNQIRKKFIDLIETAQWPELEKCQQDFKQYHPSQLLESEIQRILLTTE